MGQPVFFGGWVKNAIILFHKSHKLITFLKRLFGKLNNTTTYDLDKPIIWEGDLMDDCVAKWNGLILRAEWMNKKNWWWAVSLENTNTIDQIDSSNNHNLKCIKGEIARASAEACARVYIEALKEGIKK